MLDLNNIQDYIKTTIGLSDETNTYHYLVVLAQDTEELFSAYLAIPDYEPLVFGNSFKYYGVEIYNHTLSEQIGGYDGVDCGNVKNVLIDCTVEPQNDVLAMPNYRYDDNEYNEFCYLGSIKKSDLDKGLHIRLCTYVDDSKTLSSVISTGQGGFHNHTFTFTWFPCIIPVSISDSLTEPYLSFENLKLNSFIDASKIDYNTFKYRLKVFVVDDVNCYDMVTNSDDLKELPNDSSDLDKIPISKILRKFDSMPKYLPGLKLQCLVDIYDENEDLFITLRSIPFILTPDIYARFLCDNSEDPLQKIDSSAIKDILKDMNITRPKLYNKIVVQNVVNNNTTKSSSKQHIVQPLFMRVRELGSCVFHPQISEQICLGGLDSYKSSVSNFKLKLEGVVFGEVARVNAGVVFRIQGNLLPGELDSGVYYILDDNNDLVTTGKYTYEY